MYKVIKTYRGMRHNFEIETIRKNLTYVKACELANYLNSRIPKTNIYYYTVS